MTALADAMWAGDVDLLNELAPCQCCCDEHTYGEGCPAYQWGGCRGQGAMTRAEEASWKRHYMQHHGMTENEFYGYEQGERG